MERGLFDRYLSMLQGSEHDQKFDHEAFLGKDTAAEFDALTPEKSKERLA